ncbi:hypothetical protein DEO72_LG7g2291 [Vigna unguiculata]|uniref:Uncharacterized protein n=1 Tax=Vigna unguiculata TaxID=3917 RepID=A0A4D6MHL3_VIGUN|nr:hypothetical protein DEO72_LG7g2291 [Vigna unguiculata]
MSTMFCSQIHEHDKEHKKDECFLVRFMNTLKNTKKYFYVGLMFSFRFLNTLKTPKRSRFFL